MKKLRSILVLFLLFSTMFMVNEKVDASAGRLKTNSIITCNGLKYGEHSGHWHIAKKGKKGYYYPNGSPVSKPCSKKRKKKSSSASYSYSAGNSAKKAVVNNKVKNEDKSVKNQTDQADKETDDIDKDVDTLKEESTTPEVSNFTDTDEKTQDSDKDGYSSAGSTTMTAFIIGLIGGAGGSSLVRKKRNKKKKDDLTN